MDGSAAATVRLTLPPISPDRKEFTMADLNKAEQMHREAVSIAKAYILQQCAILFAELMEKPIPDPAVLDKGAEVIRTSVNFLKVSS